MALTRAQKEASVKALVEKLGQQKSLTFAIFSGLTVAEMTELRGKLFAANVDLSVVKNRLFARALAEAGITIEGLNLTGPLSVAFSNGDEVAGAKVLAEFAKKHEKLVITGGALEGRFLSKADVIQLAKLPSKEQLLAQVVYLIKSPVSGMVGVLRNTLGGLVNVLKNYADAQSPESAA